MRLITLITLAALTSSFCLASTNRRRNSPKAPANTLNAIRATLASYGYREQDINLLLDGQKLHRPLTRLKESPKLSWRELEDKLLSPEWLAKGGSFLLKHSPVLDQAEHQFGIPRHTIVGVLTIETLQGEFLGDWPAFLVLYKRLTRGTAGSRLDFTQMAKFCLDFAVADCHSVPGSHAGAIGLSQFMPQNLTRYGVDRNGDGKVNLFEPDEAILSTAKFLSVHAKLKCKRHRTLAPIHHGLVHYLGAKSPYQSIVLKYSSRLITQTATPTTTE